MQYHVECDQSGYVCLEPCTCYRSSWPFRIGSDTRDGLPRFVRAGRDIAWQTRRDGRCGWQSRLNGGGHSRSLLLHGSDGLIHGMRSCRGDNCSHSRRSCSQTGPVCIGRPRITQHSAAWCGCYDNLIHRHSGILVVHTSGQGSQRSHALSVEIVLPLSVCIEAILSQILVRCEARISGMWVGWRRSVLTRRLRLCAWVCPVRTISMVAQSFISTHLP